MTLEALLLTTAIASGVPAEIQKSAQGLEYRQLLLAMAKVESNFDNKAVGNHGELTLLQLRPQYHNVNHKTSIREAFQLANSYLKQLSKQCAELGPAWYICYNLGPAKAKRIKRPMQFAYFVKVEGAKREQISKRAALSN